MARRKRSSRKKRGKQKPVPIKPTPSGARPQPKPRPKPPAEPSFKRSPLSWNLVAALLIGIAIFGVYHNTLENEFVSFDDRKYIYENEFVIGDGGVGAIWGDLFDKKPRLHYYPMTFTTFWIEHKLVGLSPADVDESQVIGVQAHPLYHWTQMVLHAINAALVLFVLRALCVRFPVALFVAAMFAVHPITVAAVAWMAERKNLVSAFFLWTTLLLYLNHRPHGSPNAVPRRGLYWTSVGTFVLTITAKAASVVLVPVLIVSDRVRDGRWSLASVRRAVPFAILAFLIAGITANREQSIAKSWISLDIWLRPFIAVSAIVHYVGKVLVPVKQALIYPRWAESLLEPRYWISLAIFAGAAYLIWRFRAWLGDLWLWGLGLFLLSVAPVIGLKDFIWTQFAFVSDHYLYYGLPGVLLMVGLLLEKWWRVPAPPPAEGEPSPGRVVSTWRIAVVGALSLVALAGLGWRTVQQNRTWKNNVTLWKHTLTVSPDCFLAHLNLGNHYSRTGDPETALAHYKEWTRISPNFARAWRSCAYEARKLGRVEETIDYFRRAVEVADSKNPRAYSIQTEFAGYLRRQGRLGEALAQYEALLKKNPPNVDKIRPIVEQLRQQLLAQSPV